jgi:hypothetical protein
MVLEANNRIKSFRDGMGLWSEFACVKQVLKYSFTLRSPLWTSQYYGGFKLDPIVKTGKALV